MDPLTKRVITSSLLLFLIVCSYANPTHSPWSACSVTCGDGAKTRTLTNGSTETRPCNMPDCAATGWGPWSFLACPQGSSCGDRTYVFESRHCYGMCSGASLRTVPDQICPDCPGYGPDIARVLRGM